MNITKIIMPKTDPDVLRELASKRIQEIRKTSEYQEVSKYHDNIQKITDRIYGSWGTAITYSLFPIVLISLYFLEMDTLFGNIIATIILSFILIWVGILIYSLYKIHVYEKLIEKYKDSIDNQLHEYMIADIFEDDIKYNFINCGSIIDIDKLKKFTADDENASYLITHPVTVHKNDLEWFQQSDTLLCKIVNGQIVDQLQLYSFSYSIDEGKWSIKDNELDLSYIDERFWAGHTPYYEKGENR